MNSASARSLPKGVTADFERIDPDKAASFLAHNSHNRRFTKNLALKYSEDMRADRWLINGETIQFSDKGVLLNGQHRLTAIIESGQTIWMLVVRGLPLSAQESMDAGRKRTAGDVLSLLGYPSYNALASTARLALHIESPIRERKFTNAQVVGYVEDNPTLTDAFEDEIPPLPFSQSPKFYCYWRLTQLHRPCAEEFFAGLSDTRPLPSASPLILLDHRLKNYYRDAKAGDGWTRRQEQVALTFRAWNAWMLEEDIKQLRILRDSDGRVIIPEPVKP